MRQILKSNHIKRETWKRKKAFTVKPKTKNRILIGSHTMTFMCVCVLVLAIRILVFSFAESESNWWTIFTIDINCAARCMRAWALNSTQCTLCVWCLMCNFLIGWCRLKSLEEIFSPNSLTIVLNFTEHTLSKVWYWILMFQLFKVQVYSKYEKRQVRFLFGHSLFAK